MCVTPHRQTRPIRPYLTAIWRLPWPSSRASMPVLSTLCLCLCLNLSPCQCWCQCQCLRLPISVSVSVLSRLGAIPPLRLKRMGVCLAFACVNSIGALGGRAVNHDVTPSQVPQLSCYPASSSKRPYSPSPLRALVSRRYSNEHHHHSKQQPLSLLYDLPAPVQRE